MTDKLFYKIMPLVEKPGRYIGKEKNAVIKDKNKVDIRFAFAFPDLYEIGMSHLGMQILYSLINSLDYAWCERVFVPADDMEKFMRKYDIPLFSLESRSDIREFDFLGITLQYELSYTNILNIFNLSNINYYSKDRKDDDPIVVVGGPCAYNLEPIADFVDVAQIGEGEEIMVEFLKLYRECKKDDDYTKDKFLLRAAREIEGIYVPKFYDVKYNDDGTIQSVKANKKNIPSKITKRIIKDFDNVFYPEDFIVPNIEVVHDRMMLEIFRGCTRGCRFCQAGTLYRPIREKRVSTLLEDAKKIFKKTGFEELSLVSLSSSDYSKLEELMDKLNEYFVDKYVGVSLPSLRLDNFSLELAQKAQKVRKTGLTFALEAGSQKMRDVINKDILEKDYISTLTKVYENGWDRVKVYFMIGLPYEEDEDLEEIAKSGYTALNLFKEIRGKVFKNYTITLSGSCFVPKPFTPFQWVGQNSLESLTRKQNLIKNNIKNKHIRFNYHDSESSRIEAVFARGDRRLAPVIERAYNMGCKLDGWSEFFDYEKWEEAFKEEKISMDFYATRERDYSEIFPWDHIDCGVSKKFLIKENENAKKAVVTGDCRVGCLWCGVNVDVAKGIC